MFGCTNPNETVHFKFDRFETEGGYDYFVIGNPYQFDAYYEANFTEDTDYLDDYRENTNNRTGLMLDGNQQTGIWVTADSIQNFDIYFYRTVSPPRPKSYLAENSMTTGPSRAVRPKSYLGQN